jgi:hypothetical protein
MRNYNNKTCVICSEEYKPTTGKQYACNKCAKIYWRKKHAEQAKKRGRERKQMAIKYLGGKCKQCLLEHHAAVYEFHHRDPTQKDYNPAQALQKSWENFKLELDKCDLLCANCHRLVHHTYESNWGSDWVDDGV